MSDSPKGPSQPAGRPCPQSPDPAWATSVASGCHLSACHQGGPSPRAALCPEQEAALQRHAGKCTGKGHLLAGVVSQEVRFWRGMQVPRPQGPRTMHSPLDPGACVGTSSCSLPGLAGFIVHCPRPGQEALSVPNCSGGLIYSAELRVVATPAFPCKRPPSGGGLQEAPPTQGQCLPGTLPLASPACHGHQAGLLKALPVGPVHATTP